MSCIGKKAIDSALSAPELPAAGNENTMKKASSKTTAPAMRDNSGFTGGMRGKYARDSGRQKAGGKELAKQKAEGQGCGSNRCQFGENWARRIAPRRRGA